MGKAKAKAKKKTTGARAKRDRRRKLATEAPVSAEELLASVPGLDALQDVPAFDDLPVDEAQQTAFDDFCAHAEEPEQMQLGAVIRLDRGFPLVATADDTFRAEHAVGFAKSRGEDEVLLPAVGDRVAVRRAPGHDMGVIECVLPRRTSFERWRGRARGERQVLCSNVDSVLIDALQDVPAFDDLPVDEAQQTAFDDFCAHAEEPEQMQLGAVIRLDRGFPLVATADDTFRAEHAVGFAKSRGEDEVLLPAVGDRVAVRRAPGHDMGVIECVLPRRTSFERWRGRARGERQVLCSNVDSVLIVQALGAGEVLLDRVARSLVLALDCDAEPVVVLTKADRCDAEELERDLDRVRRLVGSDVRVIVTSSAEGRGLDEVRACVPAGSCAMILGESGAGKSTLLNALLGHDTLATGGVRERDDQGRHTTVARVMVALPGDAGVIADAPGLRSLPLVGHERGLARAFPEIVEASRACRFGDCTHTHEPGCAVREAEDAGQIDSLRLETFQNLASSMRVSAQMLDPDVHL